MASLSLFYIIKLNFPSLPFLYSEPSIFIAIEFHPRFLWVFILFIKVVQIYIVCSAVFVQIRPITDCKFPVSKNYVLLISPSVNCMFLWLHWKFMIVCKGKYEGLLEGISDFLSILVVKTILSTKLVWKGAECSNNFLLVCLANDQKILAWSAQFEEFLQIELMFRSFKH